MAWINPYRVWLSQSQSLSNSQRIVNYLYVDTKDWSKESICGLLGNIRHESSVNPNMYEYGYSWESDRGFGLVQWTPRSKYWDWALANGFNESDLRNGNAQLARIDYEVDNNIQWIPKSSNFNGLTFKEFRTNSKGLTVDELTEAFTWGYERPNEQDGIDSLPERKAFANLAFTSLDWSEGGGTPDPDPDPPDIDDDYEGIDLLTFINELKEIIKKMLTSDVFKSGNSPYYQNNYLTLLNQMDNMYKIRPSKDFFDIIESKFEDFNDSYIPPSDPDPDPDPDPPPTEVVYFPVKIQNGINFFKRSDWGVGTLQRNMTYGMRSSGRFHAGYDIGGGGYANHKVYAMVDCIIKDIRWVSGGGYSIFMEHINDDFHSMYLHLKTDSAVVNKGDTVSAGQYIATMGATGGNYAIHLHVELSKTGEFHTEANTVNPENYLGVTGSSKTDNPQP